MFSLLLQSIFFHPCKSSDWYNKILFSVVLFLSGCAHASGISLIRTPDPIQAYVDANSSQGTAVAAIATADYFSNQLTATVESRNQTATQQVLDLQSTQQAIQIQSTERAWNVTSTADSIQSTTVAAGTASAAAQQAIWTQRAVGITATASRGRKNFLLNAES